MSQYRQPADKITAGNIAAITGSNTIRTGETIVDPEFKETMTPFEEIRNPTEPVITINIEPKQTKDLPQLIQAMQRLATEDPNLTVTINRETGEYQLNGIGPLHLEIALKNLKDSTGHNIEIRTPRPIVNHRETITKAGTIAHAKSPNKLNTIAIQVQPLDQKAINLIENGSLTDQMSSKQIAETLQTQADWPRNQAENAWAIETHRNILLNLAKQSEPFSEAKDTILLGFKWACQNGPLCGEPIRGIEATIIDAQLDPDPQNRDSTQIMPATSRATLGSILTAKPTLLQPLCKIVATVPPQYVSQLTNIITKKRGKIQTIEPKGPIVNITGFIPVAGTFNLADEIRTATSGTAFWQATFDHWEKVSQDKATSIIQETRKRRGLPPQIPTADKFIDQNKSAVGSSA
jgi:elongation factor 2